MEFTKKDNFSSKKTPQQTADVYKQDIMVNL